MSEKMRAILKNQNGSSLAFVIIIGVIIMIMVVSIMSVANSDFTFTQQTVESRQAYIDAKSVIEFGKIKINNDMKYLNEYELAKKKLAELEEIKKPTSSEKKDISDLKTKISSLEPKIAEINSGYPFNIYSDKNTVTGNLLIDTLNYDGTDEIVAKCTKEGGGTQYTFDIDVQGLRRDLDYKVVIPVGDSDILNGGSKAKNTHIHATGGTVKINIKGEGNEKEESGGILYVERYDLSLDIGRDKDNKSKFEWLNGKKLELKAKNIYVTAPMPTAGVWQAEFILGDRNKTDTIWFKQNYIQNNGSGMTNTFKAKTIIFDENLTINDNTNLNIECDTLWVKGDILINASGGTNSTLNINARNIIVGDYTNNTKGNVKIGHSSKINWNCSETIFVRGDIDFSSKTVSTENLVQAKNVIIGKSSDNNSKVVINHSTKVIWDCNDFWLHGDMTTITSNSIQEFRNVEYFKSGNINLSDKCEITITGKAGSVNRIFVDGIILSKSVLKYP